ncbi:MAG TPA: aminotransferase class I/II-fold pyridoxal phosphate-dependent enzyme, partial [Agromyces sp.]
MHRIAAEPLDVLRTRTSEKWRHYDADVLPLPVAEMDYPLAEPIATALHAAVDRSDTGYAAGSRPVAEAFAPFAAERFGWQVDPGRVTCTGDVAMGLVEVLRQVTAPGDGVVITPPIYPPFFDVVTEASARVVEVPMRGGIDAAFAAGAKAMVLCNPHNPIGLVPSRGELAALAEIAARHGATIVSDEVHGPLSQPGTIYTPFLTVSDAAREVGVTVTSASKAWNIAGTKCALIKASEAL